MAQEDVTHLLPGEGNEEAQQQPQPEPTPEPEPVETVTWKVRGEERQIPVDRLDSLAEAMGTTRETALMYLQTGKDAGGVYRELRERERELAQREAEIAQRAAQFQQPSQPQRPAYGQPTHQQVQQNGLPDDPLDLLRWQAEQIRILQERMEQGFRATEEQQKLFAETVEAERRRVDSEQIDSAFKRLVEQKKQAGLPVPDWDVLEQELLDSGLAQNKRLPWDKAFERAYRNVYFDDVQRTAERKATDRLRDPKATITVTGGSGGAAKPAAAPNAADQLGGLTWGQGLDFIPESRR